MIPTRIESVRTWKTLTAYGVDRPFSYSILIQSLAPSGVAILLKRAMAKITVPAPVFDVSAFVSATSPTVEISGEQVAAAFPRPA